jgi:hypothetical protein
MEQFLKERELSEHGLQAYNFVQPDMYQTLGETCCPRFQDKKSYVT